MHQLTEECSLEVLAGRLADGFDVPIEQATDDVQQFVFMLRDKGLFE